MKKPTLYVIAGANGSGKSTLIDKHRNLIKDIKFVNPDDIAKQIDPSYDGKNTTLMRKAGREAIIQQNGLLKDGKSFGIETTFSGNRELKIMQNAKDQGYQIKLVYICLNKPTYNIKRVEERTRNGGHFVNSETIIRRYNKSISNMDKGIKIADKTYLVDNSSKKEFIVAKFQSEKVVSVTKKELPSWVKDKTTVYSKINTYKQVHKTIEKIVNNRVEKSKNKDRGLER